MRSFLTRLQGRIGLPIAAVVLASSVGVATVVVLAVRADGRVQLERTAAANATFLVHASLPTTDTMAANLARVTGLRVHFRSGGRFEPELPEAERSALAEVAADGRARALAGFEAVVVGVPGKADLVLLQNPPQPLADSRLWYALLLLWLVAFATATIVVRSLVTPLRRLARQLPRIESHEPLDLPEVARPDEIGDVARAFARTRAALHAAQDAKQRAEKLAVLGRMTASLAHEVQNPVAAIRMHAQLLRHGREPDAEATESLASIEQQAVRIESLLAQWLFLTRPEPPVRRRVDCASLLRETIEAQRAALRHAGVTVLDGVDGDLPVAADAPRLRQVFDNLLRNAVQAMPRGGAITLAGGRSGDRVRIEFLDEGHGFSETALRRLTEYFFSEREGGMGIGLAVADEIVRAHGGWLSAGNREPRGARVAVELPLAAEEANVA